MRISDWSSDVCSSDLATGEFYFDAVCRGEQCLLRICLIDLDADDAGHKFADVPALEIAFVEFATADMTCQARGSCGQFQAKLSLKDRKSVVEGRRGAVRVDLGVRGIITKKKKRAHINITR